MICSVLTPDEIERKRFAVDLRGYDKEQVHLFLKQVAEDLRGRLDARPEIEAPQRDPIDAWLDRLGAVMRVVIAEADRLLVDAKREAAALVREESDALAEIRRATERDAAVTAELREAMERDLSIAENLRAEAEREAAHILAVADHKALETVGAARERTSVAAQEATRSLRRAQDLEQEAADRSGTISELMDRLGQAPTATDVGEVLDE